MTKPARHLVLHLLLAAMLLVGNPPFAKSGNAVLAQPGRSAPVPVPALVLKNPIFPAPSQDPWVVAREGRIYEVHSNGLQIFVRSSENLGDLAKTPALPVWSAPREGRYSQNVWAPEMHWLQGKWWIFFAADDGNNDHHRIFALESETSEPTGGFRMRGEWQTDGWAIDPTVFTGEDGALYALWSGWPGQSDGEQNIYISRMSDPATLIGSRVRLTAPTESWERVALPVCEGPEVIRRGKQTFLVYSASGSWTADYCLGLLANRDGDYMNPASWEKQPKPVLAKTDKVWGVGHCAFLSSPQTGDLIFYHAKTQQANGWVDRNVRVQPFKWRADGLPDFGKPVNPGLPVAIFAQ